MERFIKLESYSLTKEADPIAAREYIVKNLKSLIWLTDLNRPQQCRYFNNIISHFNNAEKIFEIEHQQRIANLNNANLYYHNRDHSLYQTTFDAITITRGILSRSDQLSNYLSLEGITAIVIASIYHDTGFVTAQKNPLNYAALNPIHVTESINTANQALNIITPPSFLQNSKLKTLVEAGIIGTSFPYIQKQKDQFSHLIKDLTIQSRKEAHIVRLAVQLADLGGQVARVDYYPHLLKDLRQEMNSADPELQLGTTIIGEDEKLLENSISFTNSPLFLPVKKTAHAFLQDKNPFHQRWENLKLFKPCQQIAV